ncbi:MAG TPA: hypothetical protein VGE98_01575 [Thermoanaerobaculia bacterium]
MTALFVGGCSDRSSAVPYELGQPFSDQAPDVGKARIYVYWPTASPADEGRHQVCWSSVTSLPEPLLRGGYVGSDTAPGEVTMEVDHILDVWRASLSARSPALALRAESGGVYFVRAVPGKGFLEPMVLELVPPQTARPEIERCRLTRERVDGPLALTRHAGRGR